MIKNTNLVTRARRVLDPQRDATAPLAVLAGLLLLGAPLGWLWSGVSPAFKLREVLAAPESTLAAQFTVDVRFLTLSAVGGLVVGALCGRLLRTRHGSRFVGLLTAALTLGGLGCAYVAERVGILLRAPSAVPPELSRASADVRANVLDLVEFRLRVPGAVTVLPVAAIVGFSLVLWLVTRPSRDRCQPRRNRVALAPPRPITLGSAHPDRPVRSDVVARATAQRGAACGPRRRHGL